MNRWSQLTLTRRAPASTSTQDLIGAGESQTIEFKSTARINLHTQERDSRMEHVIIKTVCGFLNSEGGLLLIGVEDGGAVLGLSDDMKSLGAKQDRDSYELFLRQLLESNLSKTTAGTVRISFDVVDGKDVCLVSAASAGNPVFAVPVKGAGSSTSEFWVRIGNATRQLHGDEMVDYQRSHWD